MAIYILLYVKKGVSVLTQLGIYIIMLDYLLYVLYYIIKL